MYTARGLKLEAVADAAVIQMLAQNFLQTDASGTAQCCELKKCGCQLAVEYKNKDEEKKIGKNKAAPTTSKLQGTSPPVHVTWYPHLLLSTSLVSVCPSPPPFAYPTLPYPTLSFLMQAVRRNRLLPTLLQRPRARSCP